MGVLGLCGEQIDGGFPSIAQALSIRVDAAVSFAARLPAAAPEAISVLTLPDMRSAGDFWSLKLIEATGLCVRSVPLEEAGHVDYFVGPQSHLTIHLVGAQGAARHARLAQALAGNGQSVMIMTRPDGATASSESGDVVASAALGAYVAEEAALRWGRHPFRNGEVPMDARHIQVPT
jgi:hypothetical protein